MPKKKQKETPEEQAARFRAEVERMIADGELNPTDADRAIDKLVRKQASPAVPKTSSPPD